MNSERIRIYIAFATACLVWGSTWLAIKVGLTGMPPLLGAGLRFVIASLILFFIVRARGIEIPMTMEAKKMYGVLIFMSYSIPFAFIYWAEQYISSGLASILFAAYPFWVGIFSHAMLKDEPLNAFKIAGIGLAFAGLFIIFAGDVQIADMRTIIGMFMVIATTIMQAYSLVLVKKVGHSISPFAFNLVGMSASAVVLIGMSFLLESHESIVWDTASVGSILYLGTVGSVVVFVAYFWLLKRVQAVYLSLVSFITPIVAVVLGSLVLDETLDSNVFIGAACVLVGLLVANGKQFHGRISEAFE